MKINLDIECTPEEARQFMGLPDIKPMQDRMMQALEAQMEDNLKNLDPENFVKTWMPLATHGWADMQRQFWDTMMQTAQQHTSSEDE